MDAPHQTRPDALAVLDIDGMLLALPRDEVTIVEVTSVVNTGHTAGGAAGSILHGQRDCPVFALTKDFTLSREVAPMRSFCVCVGVNEEDVFALLCDIVTSIPETKDSELVPLPEMMKSPMTPVQYLLRSDERVVLMLDVNMLRDYLNVRAARND